MEQYTLWHSEKKSFYQYISDQMKHGNLLLFLQRKNFFQNKGRNPFNISSKSKGRDEVFNPFLGSKSGRDTSFCSQNPSNGNQIFNGKALLFLTKTTFEFQNEKENYFRNNYGNKILDTYYVSVLLLQGEQCKASVLFPQDILCITFCANNLVLLFAPKDEK